jgi:hypothetical protein
VFVTLYVSRLRTGTCHNWRGGYIIAAACAQSSRRKRLSQPSSLQDTFDVGLPVCPCAPAPLPWFYYGACGAYERRSTHGQVGTVPAKASELAEPGPSFHFNISEQDPSDTPIAQQPKLRWLPPRIPTSYRRILHGPVAVPMTPRDIWPPRVRQVCPRDPAAVAVGHCLGSRSAPGPGIPASPAPGTWGMLSRLRMMPSVLINTRLGYL